MKNSIVLFSVLLGVLAGCGGGGSSNNSANTGTDGSGTPTPPPSGSTPVWVAGQYAAETQLKDFCALPRTGIDPYSNQPYPDKSGSSMHEKLWLRSWSNNSYLWYRELPDPDPTDFSVSSYFNLLKTNSKTDSGAFKDNFHFYINTAEYKQQTQAGIESGYGIHWQFVATRVPRVLNILYVEPGSPAATVNLGRGASLLEVDGVDFVNDGTQAGVDKINAALFPTQTGQSHQFTFKDAAGVRRSYTMQSANVTTSPVHNVKVLNSSKGKVGYLQFNTHIALAQPQLIDAINLFKSNAVSELVVDLRYNGGGLLALASQFAYMVAGPNVIQDRIFDRMIFNDKYPQKDPITGQTLTPTPFYSRGIDYQKGVFTNQNLPNLSLRRIFVLTTNQTCSASEAFINGLRGVDLELIQIGGKTCGKPYGFYPADNCGTTYFTIQFSGVNAKGFGDYADGFTPTSAPQFTADIKGCAVPDDLSRALGDPQEKLLDTALQYISSGSCPVQSQTLLQQLWLSQQMTDNGSGVAIRAIDARTKAILRDSALIMQPKEPQQ